MIALGIFEGGGAKGLAHIGALQAATEAGVRFEGVAGTSAGAIVAALVAAGYSAKELYDPNDPDSVFVAKNFLEFLDPGLTQLLKGLQADIEDRVSHQRGLWNLWSLWRRYSPLLDALVATKGIFDTNRFREWFGELLFKKLARRNVQFRDLTSAAGEGKNPRYLKIIATDYVHRQIKIFGTNETPKEDVAEAVAASIAIPFFFKPVKVGTDAYVDGGVVSNFPAWVFDDERLHDKALPRDLPTFGFKLVDARTGGQTSAEDSAADKAGAHSGSIGQFAGDVLSSCLSGNSYLHVRQIQNLRIVPIPVTIGTLSFDLEGEAKNSPFNDGYRETTQFFRRYVAPLNKDLAANLLRTCSRELLTDLFEYIQGLRQQGACPQDLDGIKNVSAIHLRANIIMPMSRGVRLDGTPASPVLKVTHTHNMEEDADDALELPTDSGAAGRCWAMDDLVICDLADARDTFEKKWGMTKYHQAMVRKSLKSLLSVPVRDPRTNGPRRNLLGILSFDSDLDLLKGFAQPSVAQTAVNWANLLATHLVGGQGTS
jgi:NTE family protein